MHSLEQPLRWDRAADAPLPGALTGEGSERRKLHTVPHVVEKACQAAGRRCLDLTTDNLGDVGPTLLIECP